MGNSCGGSKDKVRPDGVVASTPTRPFTGGDGPASIKQGKQPILPLIEAAKQAATARSWVWG